jgi:hypothetical protein
LLIRFLLEKVSGLRLLIVSNEGSIFKQFNKGDGMKAYEKCLATCNLYSILNNYEKNKFGFGDGYSAAFFTGLQRRGIIKYRER